MTGRTDAELRGDVTTLRRWYTARIRVMEPMWSYLTRKIGDHSMNLQKVWPLLVSSLLACAMTHGGEKPEPDIEKPKIAMEEAVAAQKECSRTLGLPIEITNGIGMKLKLIPPGEFMMGATVADVEKILKAYPDGDRYRRFFDAEMPQHKVRITKPFYVGVYEVTQAEYERVMKENPSWFSNGGDGKDEVSGLDTSRVPVESVSWEDAVEFCRRLSAMPKERKAGGVYRLSTEAEWEYACRAGTTTPFHFGSQLNGREANCSGSYPYGTTEKGPSLGRPTTVGSYAANAFGLYDMHGNAWEWCRDCYDGGYYRSSPVDDPQGPKEAAFRVLRGGSWAIGAGSCRSAFRDMGEPQFRHRCRGFRVAADPSDTEHDD